MRDESVKKSDGLDTCYDSVDHSDRSDQNHDKIIPFSSLISDQRSLFPPPLPSDYRSRFDGDRERDDDQESLSDLAGEVETLRYIQSILQLRVNELREAHSSITELKGEISRAKQQSETIYFLKQQLRLRNQELQEETALRKILEDRIVERDLAFSTVNFLRSQLKSLTAQRDREQKLSSDLEGRMSALEAEKGQLQEHIRHLVMTDLDLADERVTASLLATELTRRDRNLKDLTDTVRLQAEIIADQRQQITRLENQVSGLQKTLFEIRHAFSPFISLFYSEDRDTERQRGFLFADDLEFAPGDYEDIKTLTLTDHRIVTGRENVEENPWRKSKIVSLFGSHERTPGPVNRIKWSRVSILLIFFFLTTFGTTDLFSHFQPFSFSSPNIDQNFLPSMPELLTIPMSQHAIALSWRTMQHAIMQRPMVILDPGHGGNDHGAVTPDGWRESDFSLAMALETEKYLKSIGIPVMLTRRTDHSLSLESRKSIANRFPGSMFVSMHLNAHPRNSTRDANGFSVFINDDQSIPLARTIYSSTREILFLGNYNQGIIDGRRFYNDGNNRLGVLKDLLNPGVLVETCFISHPRDIILIKDNTFRERLAQRIAVGIDDYRHDIR